MLLGRQAAEAVAEDFVRGRRQAIDGDHHRQEEADDEHGQSGSPDPRHGRTLDGPGAALRWSAMALERVADGVWLLRGDFRGAMNIYFLEDGDGVVQFDAGTKAMRKKAKATATELGGLKRVVLGHAHADHRGTAPYLDAPVLCHPDEKIDAESSAAIAPYWDLSQLPVAWVRWIYPL